MFGPSVKGRGSLCCSVTTRRYTREAGVRNLERELSTLVRKAVKELILSEKKSVKASANNLAEYLGVPKYLSFPKITSGLDSPRAAESSHDLRGCLRSCTRSECSSPIYSSRGAGLKPRIYFSVISSTSLCGGYHLVFDFAAATGHYSNG